MERASLVYDITLSNILTDLYRRYADKTGRNDPFRHARIRATQISWMGEALGKKFRELSGRTLTYG